MTELVASVAVVIPAKNEAARIAATVAAARTIDGVDLVVVVDDGSTDQTAALATGAGATVTRHERTRGKAAAMETGAELVRRARPAGAASRRRRPLLFLDADLEDTARNAAPLVPPVLAGDADMTIATLAAAEPAGRRPRAGGQPLAEGHRVGDRVHGDAAAVRATLPDPEGVRGGDSARAGVRCRDRPDDRPAAAGLPGP